MGLRLDIVVDPGERRVVHECAAENIVGYSVPSAGYGEQLERHVQRAFAGAVGLRPSPETVFAVVDEDTGAVEAGAIIEVSGVSVPNADAAKEIAHWHRVLSALFVSPPSRGHGLGRQLLLDVVAPAVAQSGARYLDGYVDDRNKGSVDFYRRVGAHIAPRGAGLPRRDPTQRDLLTPPGASPGHWFYLDAAELFSDRLQCVRCAGALRYSHLTGQVTCPTCGPRPPT